MMMYVRSAPLAELAELAELAVPSALDLAATAALNGTAVTRTAAGATASAIHLLCARMPYLPLAWLLTLDWISTERIGS
jgi:hypothetical protein